MRMVTVKNLCSAQMLDILAKLNQKEKMHEIEIKRITPKLE